ncbi:hypothetical protein THAOC_13685 [Thalassiosira oceanica]|uniref:Uncharacterized protein n=1 Tax=Thalassiosira oceanica TaxID=159749 RepID=K0SGX9_THAOC|nr:hypothetical protein THAOC_13685 [Thalassiosira oceanica]|eukprot:EJK65448.1 hypothetical protein THAOC_13685 [Thalassiosira oceanica]
MRNAASNLNGVQCARQIKAGLTAALVTLWSGQRRGKSVATKWDAAGSSRTSGSDCPLSTTTSIASHGYSASAQAFLQVGMSQIQASSSALTRRGSSSGSAKVVGSQVSLATMTGRPSVDKAGVQPGRVGWRSVLAFVTYIPLSSCDVAWYCAASSYCSSSSFSSVSPLQQRREVSEVDSWSVVRRPSLAIRSECCVARHATCGQSEGKGEGGKIGSWQALALSVVAFQTRKKCMVQNFPPSPLVYTVILDNIDLHGQLDHKETHSDEAEATQHT